MAWGVAATARHSDGLLVSFGKRSKFRESVRKPFAGRLDVLCAQEFPCSENPLAELSGFLRNVGYGAAAH
jgi:hypothetical protein